MANNRLYLQCKKKDCEEAIMLAKFYPSGGFIAGEGAGWYVPSGGLTERLNEFFQKHQHKFDKSMFGANQYDIAYEVIGDGSTITEKIFGAIKAATKNPQKNKKTSPQ